MRIIVYFTLAVLTPITLVTLSQIPLVSDLVTASGYSSTEVFAGLGAIMFVLTTFAAIVDGVR